MRTTLTTVFVSAFLLLFSTSYAAPPADFRDAKPLIHAVYKDHPETLYCGCSISWTYGSSGQPDLKGCGYSVRHSSPSRANRIEWEHIVPAWNLGHQRECWQSGGRSECRSNDPAFNLMAANLHNLAPSIGEVNADRSNYRFSPLSSTPRQHGQCPFKVDFGQRAVEPRDSVKGFVARVYFYMHDHYALRLSAQQERVLMAWDKMYPPNEWERVRNRRIAEVMGHGNPFVTGKKEWTTGFKPEGAGLTGQAESGPGHSLSPAGEIRGNRNSMIYHRPDCPSYERIAPRNIAPFQSEDAAKTAGYRIAGNC